MKSFKLQHHDDSPHRPSTDHHRRRSRDSDRERSPSSTAAAAAADISPSPLAGMGMTSSALQSVNSTATRAKEGLLFGELMTGKMNCELQKETGLVQLRLLPLATRHLQGGRRTRTGNRAEIRDCKAFCLSSDWRDELQGERLEWQREGDTDSCKDGHSADRPHHYRTQQIQWRLRENLLVKQQRIQINSLFSSSLSSILVRLQSSANFSCKILWILSCVYQDFCSINIICSDKLD